MPTDKLTTKPKKSAAQDKAAQDKAAQDQVAQEKAVEEQGALSRQARALGFSCVGVSAPRLGEVARARLQHFVSEGQHGTMAWFAKRLEERIDPRKLWREARSAIVLGIDYTPDGDAYKTWQRKLANRKLAGIALYAQGEDYHEIVKKRLKVFARWLCSEYSTQAKVFVDTAPLSEKSLAAQARLGWIGKNTQLVSRSHGCWLLLGVVLAAREFAPTSFSRTISREGGSCGSCRRCLDVCPTAAFPHAYALDARRCLSYLTIEHRGVIPREFREAMGNRVFGCDDCLAVCPWNKFARVAREIREGAGIKASRQASGEGKGEEEGEREGKGEGEGKGEEEGEREGKGEEASMAVALRSRRDLGAGKIAEWLRLEEAEFRLLFRKTVVKRLKISGFRRNLLLAAGNSGDMDLLPLVEQCLGHDDAVVRASAVWAVWRLGGGERIRELAEELLAGEEDAVVREEWNWCLREQSSCG